MPNGHSEQSPADQTSVPGVGSSGDSGWAGLLRASRPVQALEIAVVFSPILIVIVAARMLEVDNPAVQIAAVWLANVVMLVLVSLGVWLRGDSASSIGLSVAGAHMAHVGWFALRSIAVLAFALAGFAIGSVVMANIVGIPEGADMTKYNYLRGNLPLLLVSLAGVYVVSSFGEEVVYRGFLVTRLEALFGSAGRWRTVGAIVLSSVIFGFAHFEWGAMGIGQTTCMGAALAIAFVWTKRSLWPLVAAHACMDTLLLVPLYFAPESAA